VFQLAHVVEETENPTPNELERWVILGQFINYLQQLILLQKNKIVNWYTGGLNHQIEHHIFPNISHIHYGNIAKSLKKLQQNATYRITNTKQCAVVIAHFKHLKDLE
jgi:linoleoyl-CoA desaturase